MRLGQQYGTGWWISDKYVVTAAHVVNYQDGVEVELIHYPWVSKGRVVAVDRDNDVAVIAVEIPDPTSNPLPLCDEVVKGQEVVAVGYPFETVKVAGSLEAASANPRAAYGIITWVRGDGLLAEMDVIIDQGNSGGPVIDVDAKCVVGLVSYALRGVAGVMYYISTQKAIAQLLDSKGISYRTVHIEAAAAPAPLPQPIGVRSIDTRLILVGLGALILGVILARASGGRAYAVLIPLLLAVMLSRTALAEKVMLVDQEGDSATNYYGTLVPGERLEVKMFLRYDMWVTGHSTTDTRIELGWKGGTIEAYTEGDMPPFDPNWHAYLIIRVNDWVKRVEIGSGPRGWGTGIAEARVVFTYGCDGTLYIRVYSKDGKRLAETSVNTGGAKIYVYTDDDLYNPDTGTRRVSKIAFEECGGSWSWDDQGPRLDQPPGLGERIQRWLSDPWKAVLLFSGIFVVAAIAMVMLAAAGRR